MTRLLLALIIFVTLTLLTISQVQQEKWLAIKISDFNKEITYKTVSETEYNQINKDISLEQKIFQKALSEAEKTWKEDERLKKYPFPMSAIRPRKVDILGTYTSKEEADKKIARYNEEEDKDKTKSKSDDARTKALAKILPKNKNTSTAKNDSDEAERLKRIQEAIAIFKRCLETVKENLNSEAVQKEEAQ